MDRIKRSRFFRSFSDSGRARPRAVTDVLLNDDILQVIVDYIYSCGKDRATLLALALTSKELANIALERLWYEQESIHPLLTILAHSGHIRGRNTWINEFKETATDHYSVKSSQAKHFSIYARWIRILWWKNDETLSAGQVDDLFSWNPSHALLLPQLRVLHWYENDAGRFPLYKIFFGPQLRAIQFSWDPRFFKNSAAHVHNFLRDIGDHNFPLTSLDIGIPLEDMYPTLADHFLSNHLANPDDIVSDIEEILKRSCKPIETLRIGLSSPFSQALSPSCLPVVSLVSLSLELWPSSKLAPLTLPNLKSLGLSFAFPTTEQIPFVKTLSCPILEDLQLSFGLQSSHIFWPDYPHTMIQASEIYHLGIVPSQFFRHVQRLKLTHFTLHLVPEDSLPEERSLFDALLSSPFPSLVSLDIVSCRLVVTLDDLTKALPRAYPHLHTLGLRRPWALDGRTATALIIECTFTQLLRVVRCFPCLHTLALPALDGAIDSVVALWCPVRPPCMLLRRWDAGLTHVCLHNWSDRSAKQIARQFRLAFPNLEELDYMPFHPDTSLSTRNASGWKEIVRHVKREYAARH
ncbi:hypothetical protein PsYK624_159680 [Phanerochaete sordida]|uniref:F-box domain-containing protein n=1 Tax=Phanerochaete sordida TaxID=48140 RepID=A0A9P3GQK9_9APHY|nr:hypothetical protein PsYK624_159680 [Phanerochaete sordida]